MGHIQSIRSLVADLRSTEGIPASEALALGIALGLRGELPKSGRNYVVDDELAERIREELRAHYRRVGRKVPASS